MRVHIRVLKLPIADVLKVMLPLGVRPMPIGELSVTVAVHWLVWFTTTEPGEHVILVWVYHC